MLTAAAIVTTGRTLLSLVCFRAAPMVVWAALSPGVSVRVRVGAALAGVGLASFIATQSSLPLGWLVTAYVYFAAAGLGARSLSRALRTERITGGAVFALSLSAFVVIPGLFVPVGAKTLVLVLGWELMLSAYSYCVETAKMERPTSISDCLFFLLVNPALVYADRGKRFGGIAFNPAGFRRAALGLCGLFIAIGVLAEASTAERATTVGAQLAGVGALRPVGLFQQYLEHSGLAGLQIGMMCQLGYAVPERYRRPFLASGPDDFWRRWNIYVGTWMQRYLFWPLSLTMARSRSTFERRGAQVIGVLVTFACVGALHDVSGYLIGFGTVGQSLFVFSASAVLLLAWAGASQVWRAFLPSSVERQWLRIGLGALSRVLFWWSAFALFYAWTK